jgi:predicted TPR repeat methyltransferase
VLDLGAGNGMSGEALQSLAIRRMIAVDIIPEAREAALRDRPWVYNDYHIADLTKDSPEFDAAAKAAKVNTLVTIAALGFGDIPPRAFYHAFNLIEKPGWLAFNIKESFLEESDGGGFAGLIGRMRRADILRVDMFKRYRHRLSIAGEPLYYVAMIARKLKDIPPDLLAEAESGAA